MTTTSLARLFGPILCAALLALAPGTAQAQAQKTMYEKFGGKEGVAKIVNDFVAIVVADPRINFQFAKADAGRLVAMLNDQICAATGGGCEYKGRDMKTAHAGMNITNAQFNALAEDMYAAWDKNNIPYHLQNKLMAILAPMQKDIVTR